MNPMRLFASLAALLIAITASLPVFAAAPLENGDIIVRKGKGLWSDYFAGLSKNERLYSHAGIVIIKGSDLYVAHSEADDLSGQGRARLEPYAEFVAASTRTAVFRVALPADTRKKIAETASRLAARGVPFDTAFSLETDDVLYCTEFVWYAVLAATRLDIVPQKSSLLGRRYVSVEDLYRSRYVSVIDAR